MDVSYRRDKDHNYMILDTPGELTGEEYQVRMLVGNHIPHLLKCNRRMMDGKAVFFYEVTGMQPMFRVFEKRQINQEEMVELLQDIKEALENTQRYLLDGNQLLFEPEFLFFHTQTREWNLCYLPTYDGNMTESFRKLSEYLLKRLDHSDEHAWIRSIQQSIRRKLSDIGSAADDLSGWTEKLCSGGRIAGRPGTVRESENFKKVGSF